MHPRIILSVGNFFFAIFSSLVSIILIPYLSLFMPEAYTGFVIAGSAFFTLVLFPFLPRLVERVGAQQVALAFALIEIVILFALAAAPGALTAVFLIAFTTILSPFLAYEFDLLLEATTADTKTMGEVRALFRTAYNVAALAGPLLLGALLANSDSYDRVFIAAAAMLTPIVILFSARRLPKGPRPRRASVGHTLAIIARNKDLGAVTFANLLLYLFFVWMPIYAPFYLHNILGIPWSTLGWVFSLVLVPYILVEYPAGWIADRYLGDKELMLAGFVIAGAGLIALSFVTTTTSLAVIVAILFCSRIGAALAESMIDGHFFRRVSKRDIASVEVFRSAWPLSYLVGPIVASTILLVSNYPTLFVLTGGVVSIGGVIATAFIKDFR